MEGETIRGLELKVTEHEGRITRLEKRIGDIEEDLKDIMEELTKLREAMAGLKVYTYVTWFFLSGIIMVLIGIAFGWFAQ